MFLLSGWRLIACHGVLVCLPCKSILALLSLFYEFSSLICTKNLWRWANHLDLKLLGVVVVDSGLSYRRIGSCEYVFYLSGWQCLSNLAFVHLLCQCQGFCGLFVQWFLIIGSNCRNIDWLRLHWVVHIRWNVVLALSNTHFVFNNLSGCQRWAILSMSMMILLAIFSMRIVHSRYAVFLLPKQAVVLCLTQNATIFGCVSPRANAAL